MSQFPVPVTLRAMLSQFQADLETAKGMYRAFAGEIEAQGVNIRGGTPAGDGTRPPLVMQAANLQNNGGPHSAPTVAGGGNAAAMGGGGGGGVPPGFTRAQWQGILESRAVTQAGGPTALGLVSPTPPAQQASAVATAAMHARTANSSAYAQADLHGAPAAQERPPDTGQAKNNMSIYMKRIIATMAIDAAAGLVAGGAQYDAAMFMSGNNQMMQARATLNLRKSMFQAIPLIGGSLSTIATSMDEAYLDKTQLEQDESSATFAAGSAIKFNAQRGRAAAFSSSSFARGMMNSRTAQDAASDQIRKTRAAEFEAKQRPQMMPDEIPKDRFGHGTLIGLPDEAARRVQAHYATHYKAGGTLEDSYNAVRSGYNDTITKPFNSMTAAMIAALPNSLERQGMEEQFGLEQNITMAGTAAKNAAAQLRGTSGGIAAIGSIANAKSALLRKQMAGLAADDPLRQTLEGARVNDLQSAKADVLVAQTENFRNIFGGRPQEIGAMQSVEAMRDLSPDTAENIQAQVLETLKSIERELTKNSQ